MIIFYILTTLFLDNVWTLLGENCCWSLWGLKGLTRFAAVLVLQNKLLFLLPTLPLACG